MKPFLQCSWMFETEAWAFLIPTGNFHFVRASVPERLALPASNVAVGSVFNLDFHVNKEVIPLIHEIVTCISVSNAMILIIPSQMEVAQAQGAD